MKQSEAKAAIVREWLDLPPQERLTERQAAMFAMKAIRRYSFRASGDPYQTAKGWLLGYLGRP